MIKAKFLLFSALLAGGVFFSACSDTVSDDFCDAEKPCDTGFECNLATNNCESNTEPDAGRDIDAGGDIDATSIAVCEGANHCVAEIPSDWIGPIVYTMAATENELAACPSEYSDEVAVLGLDVALTQDCECSCGTVANAQCGNAEMRASDGLPLCQPAFCGAGSSCPTTVEVSVGNYRAVDEFRGNTTGFVPGPLTGGSCTSPTGPSTFTSNFNSMSRLCRASLEDAECGQDEICAPLAPSKFNQQQCIVSQGELNCPTDSPYTERQILYATVDDQRVCNKSACSCEVEGNCGGAMRFGDLLSSPVTIDQTIFSCMDIPDFPFLFFQYFPDSSHACTLNGAAAITGAATPTGVTTLCCEPAL